VPELSRFFGIVVRMYYDDHEPLHIHVEYSGDIAVIDFQGNIIQGTLNSRTALYLTREWINLHLVELETDWNLAKNGREIRKIAPLE